MLTTNEIIKKTGVKPSVLAYLIREGKVPCERRGKGIPTLYPSDAIEIILQFLDRTGQSSEVDGIGGEGNER